METIVEKFVLQLEAQLAERRVAITLTPEARAWLATKGYDAGLRRPAARARHPARGPRPADRRAPLRPARARRHGDHRRRRRRADVRRMSRKPSRDAMKTLEHRHRRMSPRIGTREDPVMSDLKVTDRRWWAREEATRRTTAKNRGSSPPTSRSSRQRLAAKDAELQQLIAKYRGAVGRVRSGARAAAQGSHEGRRARPALAHRAFPRSARQPRPRARRRRRSRRRSVRPGRLARAPAVPDHARGPRRPRLDPLGQPFDPARHEAVATIAAAGTPPGTIVGVVRPGYVIGDEVLRPAQVAVAG